MCHRKAPLRGKPRCTPPRRLPHSTRVCIAACHAALAPGTATARQVRAPPLTTKDPREQAHRPHAPEPLEPLASRMPARCQAHTGGTTQLPPGAEAKKRAAVATRSAAPGKASFATCPGPIRTPDHSRRQMPTGMPGSTTNAPPRWFALEASPQARPVLSVIVWHMSSEAGSSYAWRQRIALCYSCCVAATNKRAGSAPRGGLVLARPVLARAARVRELRARSLNITCCEARGPHQRYSRMM